MANIILREISKRQELLKTQEEKELRLVEIASKIKELEAERAAIQLCDTEVIKQEIEELEGYAVKLGLMPAPAVEEEVAQEIAQVVGEAEPEIAPQEATRVVF